eukprot:7599_1
MDPSLREINVTIKALRKTIDDLHRERRQEQAFLEHAGLTDHPLAKYGKHQIIQSIHKMLDKPQIELLIEDLKQTRTKVRDTDGITVSGYVREVTSKHKTLEIPEPIISEINKFYFDGVFEYCDDFDENGILYFLGTNWHTKAWMNPALNNLGVKATASSIMADSQPIESICGRSLVRCVTTPVKQAWMMLEFEHIYVDVTRYTIKHYATWDTEALREWNFEGSNDGATWDLLVAHRQDTSLAKIGATATWTVDSQGRRYKRFRIIQKGHNSNMHFYLACSGIELYGSIHLT